MKKLSFKNIVTIISLGIILIITISFIVLYFVTKKPVAAFYGIAENSKAGIETVLQTTYKRKNKKSLPYEIVVLDNNLSLKEALRHSKKPDILFIEAGLNADYAASFVQKKKRGFPLSILNGMTSSIKNITPIANNKVNAVPILIDNYELDIEVESFRNSGITSINYWKDIQDLAVKIQTSKAAPILYSAKEDETIINVFGALVESFAGIDAWKSLVEKIKTTLQTKNPTYSTFMELLSKMNKEGGELYEVVKFIKDSKMVGAIPKNIELTSLNDVKAYMSADLAGIVFMTLSQHRTIEYKTISKYSSIYYPSASYNVQRHFTSPVIFAVPYKKNKIARASIELLADSLQSSLSSRTGLAPTQANCSTPDKQADDVRYWVAASESPLPTLSNAAFTSKSERTAFAEVLRNITRM